MSTSNVDKHADKNREWVLLMWTNMLINSRCCLMSVYICLSKANWHNMTQSGPASVCFWLMMYLKKNDRTLLPIFIVSEVYSVNHSANYNIYNIYCAKDLQEQLFMAKSPSLSSEQAERRGEERRRRRRRRRHYLTVPIIASSVISGKCSSTPHWYWAY